MQGEGVLLAIAQIAVVFAGFSALVAAFRGRFTAIDVQAVRVMVEACLGAAFFALLPPILAYSVPNEALLLRVLSGALAGYLLIWTILVLRRYRTRRLRMRRPWGLRVVLGEGLVALALLVANAVWWANLAPYAFGLIDLLSVAGLQFLVFAILMDSPDAENESTHSRPGSESAKTRRG